jgi:16S rRNA A1518/A1519 N6-dimethyltransferase RsmA/KsgA/DIM1 with predicted DNA glycosylase/AP lyase activity
LSEHLLQDKSPQPQVDSTTADFRYNREKSALIADMELFGRAVNLYMPHCRKTLMASSKPARGELSQNYPEIFLKMLHKSLKNDLNNSA